MIPKFRAWDKLTDTVQDVLDINFKEKTVTVSQKDIVWYKHDNLRPFKGVILMQSTGLKDKNGAEIYVGDIVRHSHIVTDISIVRFGEFGVPNMEEQSYQDCAVGFYYENASEFKDIEPFNMTVPLNSDYVKDVLVIGNIYANPELLNNL